MGEEEIEIDEEIYLDIIVHLGAARSTMPLKQWREIKQRVTGEEWKQLKVRKIGKVSKFNFGRVGMIKVEFSGLLPIRALKLNVIDVDVPLLLGIEAIERLKVP